MKVNLIHDKIEKVQLIKRKYGKRLISESVMCWDTSSNIKDILRCNINTGVCLNNARDTQCCTQDVCHIAICQYLQLGFSTLEHFNTSHGRSSCRKAFKHMSCCKGIYSINFSWTGKTLRDSDSHTKCSLRVGLNIGQDQLLLSHRDCTPVYCKNTFLSARRWHLISSWRQQMLRMPPCECCL